ncbi:hypothetical protein CC80DRAFT_505125 [Byssothecium circinans]|uniref:Small secreted protein n=1 Tax=Byssothecium circinans TaxID=147558 RepID=A0A6A5TT31_9PLEO|nr:hypothetical protein CC80DRAFT_505125 [Byssothecium circinans]
MHFSAITVLSLTAIAAALPTTKRQAGAAVLATTTYDDISISGGTAGQAEAEALALFSGLDLENPENIAAEDQDFLNEVNQVANDAETEAFNPAIEAATGAEAEALEAGKTKNKVLKLMATVLKLEAQQAQGEDVAAKLAEEQTKLDNNIATDVENAGNPSTALAFDATIQGAGAGAAGANGAGANAADAEAEAGANAGAKGKGKGAKNNAGNAAEEDVNAANAEEDADDADTEAEVEAGANAGAKGKGKGAKNNAGNAAEEDANAANAEEDADDADAEVEAEAGANAGAKGKGKGAKAAKNN